MSIIIHTQSSECPFARLSSLFGSVGNTLANVFCNIQPPKLTLGEQIRPKPGYYYQPPNTTANPPDQRGLCPGLNLLANYGYLPRNGIVNFTQVLNAVVDGFNMGDDLATLLISLQIVSSGNIATETFSIGGPDPRVGISNIGGLDRHNAVECDISPNREDSYTGKCDNHHLSSRRFKQNVQCAEQQGGLFNLSAMTSQYAKNAAFSKANNPYLFYSPLSFIVSVGAHIFYTYFFSNGTYEVGGTPDYTSISYIVGANLTTNGSDYEFEYIPERWPEVNNSAGKPWYRRAHPFTFVELLTLIPKVYAANPVGIPFGRIEISNLTPQIIGCKPYYTLLQSTPIFAAQSEQNAAAALTWIIAKLDPIFNGITFGCPANSFSSNGGNFTANNTDIPITCTEKTNQYNNIYFP